MIPTTKKQKIQKILERIALEDARIEKHMEAVETALKERHFYYTLLVEKLKELK